MRTALMVAAAMLCGTPALAADVSVTLTGIKPKGGEIHVAIYDKDNFLKSPARVLRLKLPGNTASVVASDLPPGDYAIAAIHDVDGSGTLTMKDGRMTEGSAMTRAEQLRGMPTFDTTKVTVPATGAAFTLAMSYPEDRQYW